MANLRADNITGTGGRNAIDGSVFFGNTTDSDINYLELADNADLEFGSGDYTVEFWAMFKKTASSNTYEEIVNKGYPFQIFRNAYNNQVLLAVDSNTTSYDINTSFGTAERDTWHHIAVSRSGNTTKAFLNGVEGLSSTSSTSIYDSSSKFSIGRYSDSASYKFWGYVSNLRVVKGTALYTASFTPPTEKLTLVSNTVLLCCQDSNDPTQEATGKTITAYGDLDYSDEVELVTGSWTHDANGSGSGSGSGRNITVTGSGLSNRGVVYQTCTVVSGKKYVFSYRAASAGANCKIGIDSNDGTSNVIGTVGNNPDLLYTEMINGDATVTSGNYYRATFTASTTSAVVYFQEAGTGTFKADDISLKLSPNSADGAKNFKDLPPVGVDEGVTFSGDTTINSKNYMYFPTGDTSQRGRGRALVAGGSVPGNSTAIDYFLIQSTANTQDFGDLTVAGQHTACSSTTRGVLAMGSNNNTIDYVTITTTGNATNFGDRTVALNGPGALSNNIRGVFLGGGSPSPQSDVMDYITIATTGDATDFGNLSSGNKNGCGLASPTRGCIAHGGDPLTNVIDYITIATTGNATDFGDTVQAGEGYSGSSSSTRGVWSGGYVQPANQNVIQYITIASTGNAADFGDLDRLTCQSGTGTSNSLRGVTSGGFTPSPSTTATNTMDYITIATTGNSNDFGDITSARAYLGSCSDSHGGLS